MKANELMIGDWVIATNSAHQLDAGDLKNIFVNLENDGKDDARYLSPIPLTPEILEKNGWLKRGRFYERHDVEFELKVYRDDTVFGILLPDDYGTAILTDIKYVHELQHTLRLCGIKKEIII